ncbi:MAG: nuclear transport factor 2 family protein [Saprospiraceae bacterium]|nr:nuclear transport factor 2 family protein [Saprospiraceae bacterium]
MKACIFLIFTSLGILVGCTSKSNKDTESANTSSIEAAKSSILQTLNAETAAAFNRDYEAWKTFWVHEDFVSKTYINFTDSTSTETLGWEEVDDFVRSYIEAHPEPDPLPEALKDIDIRLYGNAAWVSYTQEEVRGTKRETRLMEKEDRKWKIAGMHTTIYPPSTTNN